MNQLPGKANYLIGNDPAKWRTDIPTYARVKYRNVYPGIDVAYYGNGNQLEHDFIVGAGADPRHISYMVDGLTKLSIDTNGALLIGDAIEGIRLRKPLIYQQDGDMRSEVSGGYQITAEHQVSFSIGQYDNGRDLIIDPMFVYSSFLGGGGYEDRGSGSEAKRADIAVDAEGNAYVTGNTDSLDFPTAAPLQRTPAGATTEPNYPGDVVRAMHADAFVVKLSPSGSLIYSTYLGGSGLERGFGIAADRYGNAYVAGRTQSADFPTSNPLQQTLRGTEDAFISMLAPDGSALVYSTYLGGSNSDDAVSIALDSSGSAYVVGETQSIDFPTVNPFQRTMGGVLDVYLAKLSPNGSTLAFSTYLGGSGPDDVEDVAVDTAGNAYVIGTTASYNFPVLNAVLPTLKIVDAFVSKFGTTGSLVYSTYLGGSAEDAGTSLAVDSSGNAYAAGVTLSTDFPVANALKASAGDTLFKSGDGGDSWAAVNGAPNNIKSLAVDPTAPSTLYAATGQGVFKSINGGQTWNAINSGLPPWTVYGLAVNPQDPATLYAGVFGAGVFKSTNGGQSWAEVNSGLSNKDILSLVLSPSDPSTIYVGCNFSSQTDSAGVYGSTDGGESWTYVGAGLEAAYGINAIVVDPDQPRTVYAGGNSIYKSTDGGQSWVLSGSDLFALQLVVDPANHNNVFAGTFGGFAKSIDAGVSWRISNDGLAETDVRCLGLDLTSTATIYAGTPEGLFKSNDAGDTWRSVGTNIARRAVRAVLVDPTNAATVYVGCPVGLKMFLSKLNSAGSSLVYSTYLGGSAEEVLHAIAVDTAGNAYLTGTTISLDFPVVNAMQDSRKGWRDAFLTKVQASGRALAYSTFLGGGGNDYGYGVAVDAAANVYLTGVLAGSPDFQTAFPFQRTSRVYDTDAFVAKISDSSPVFAIRDRGGTAWQTSGAGESLAVGYARIQPDAGSTTPSGVAIFGFRENGILVTEAGVPASPLVQSGRIHAEINSWVNTGLAIANPGDAAAAISFFFTDSNGVDFGHGTTAVPAGGQIACFLSESPFGGNAPLSGTFSFSSSRPVSVVAMRGLDNERAEFLLTTLPVTELSAVAQDTMVFPHYADGGGWYTQLVLINPTNEAMSGIAEFFSSTGEPGKVTIGDQMDHNFSWSIQPRSSCILRTSGIPDKTLAGWVLVTPATNSKTPAGLAVFSFRSVGVTVTEAGVPAVRPEIAFRIYVESSGDFFAGEAGSIQTGVAIANPSAAPVLLKLELTGLSGSAAGAVGTLVVPARGQTALFLNQIAGFESLQLPFRGVLRISTASTAARVSAIGLRGRYNERRDFLITTTPSASETTPAASLELLFPHFATGGGYTTQFVLFSGSAGQVSSGILRLISQSGRTLP